MILISIVFLAIAVSFDTFAIGITYGMNQIGIPRKSKLILCFISGSVFFVTMLAGSLLEKWLNPRFTSQLGGLIFIILGIYNLWRNYRVTKEETELLINWRIPFLGLVIQVFHEPLQADIDASKHITGSEAIVLGAALALDSIAAGLGAAVLNLPLIITTLAVMCANFIFVTKGLDVGKKAASAKYLQRKWHWLPGTMIFFIGILKLFF